MQKCHEVMLTMLLINNFGIRYPSQQNVESPIRGSAAVSLGEKGKRLPLIWGNQTEFTGYETLFTGKRRAG